MSVDLAPDAPLDQVEWRVQGKIDRGDGVQVVAYLDAPTVSKLLDDWVGPDRWRDHYEPTGKPGTMWCHLSVRFGDEWVTKEDLGTASDMEADKGLVSDAFKRVAMRKWGVGRNVFDLPVLRITKFRKVDRAGKDPMAYLTGESHTEIAARLRQLGFEDAAEHAEKAVVDDTPDAPVPDDEHQALLDELEIFLDKAADVGADGDPDSAREYAKRSASHARKAIESVVTKIEAAERPADDEPGPDPSEGDVPPSSPSEAPDPKDCAHDGPVDRIGIARTRCRRCGTTGGPDGPGTRAPAEPAEAPDDAEPAATDEGWRAVAEDLGVAKAAVLNALRKDWPHNSQWNKPNRFADVDRLAADDEWVNRIGDLIGDLARGQEAS